MGNLSEAEAIRILKENSCCVLSDDAEKKKWIEALDMAVAALDNQVRLRRMIALWKDGDRN